MLYEDQKKKISNDTASDETFLAGSKAPNVIQASKIYFDGRFSLKKNHCTTICIILNQVQRQCFLFSDCPEILLQLQHF